VGSLSWPSLVRLGLAVWERLSKTGRQPMVDARAKAVRAAMAAVARRNLYRRDGMFQGDRSVLQT